MSGFKISASILLVLLATAALIAGIGLAAEGSDFWLYQTFAPRREAVRREVFEQARSYQEGMAQQLWAAQVEYASADTSGRAAIRSAVLHQVAGYDVKRLPTDLQSFVRTLQADSLGMSGRAVGVP